MKIGAEMHVCFARLRVKIHVTRPIVHDVIERQRDNPDTHMEAANLNLIFFFFFLPALVFCEDYIKGAARM